MNSSSEAGAALGVQTNSQRPLFYGHSSPIHENGNLTGALDVLRDITDQRCFDDARRSAERISAFARVAVEVAQLKPALPPMVHLLNSLGRNATLIVAVGGYTELAQVELVRFDALVKGMANLAGAA